VAAGILGTAGGITSLISYPALLATGLSPLAANATNIVALNACWPGSAHGSSRELAGQRRWLLRWLPVAGFGGALGAALVLITPPGAFARVVPFLILAGSIALIAEPWLHGLRDLRAQRGTDGASGGRSGGRPGGRSAGGYPGGRSAGGRPGGRLRGWQRLRGRRREPLLAGALVLVSVYGGYFGAGSGVMTLALLLLVVSRELPVANALKNMVNGAVTLPAGILLACLGPVHWLHAAALGLGALIGSRIGPVLTRALPHALTRWSVALLGLGLAAWLWVRPRT